MTALERVQKGLDNYSHEARQSMLHYLDFCGCLIIMPAVQSSGGIMLTITMLDNYITIK